MGLVPCPLPCRTYSTESESNSSYHLHSDPSTSSISSQPSLPSVPSLSRQVLQQTQTTQLNCIATRKSGSACVCSLVLAGKFLYTGLSDGEIRSWSCRDISSNTSKPLATTNSTVKSLVIVGDKIFSAHQDHKIRVWQVNTTNEQKFKCKCIATLPTLKDRFPRLFFPNSYVQVRRHKKLTWVHHADAISALAVSKDESLLYSASWDRTFKIWRTSDFKCLESVSNAHEDAINAIVVSNDGFVYTGSADKKIKVWKKLIGEKHHTLVESLEKHKSAVNALAFSSDGSVLYSGACDRSILVWERDNGGGGGMVVVGALRGHTKAILCLAVAGNLVCSGSADCSVRIWRRGVGDDRSYSCLGVLEGHRRPVKCLTVAVDFDGDDRSDYVNSFVVYSGSLDCNIKVWQIQVPLVNSI
ncbi:putative transcription factor WD40-like family [Rosa chinensis]|uniref:Putative transcription factor WD40-like family n=1 Tax=Rosa chinensis TaxID=74649 RepID=A0A2P6R4A4_ROSCH|nr:protein JINGUBANG [Rosa chinensis]PRQ41238.1 putative transcription factor WD40-like family [Rosa chinensis]